jgi:hypothetical protein
LRTITAYDAMGRVTQEQRCSGTSNCNSQVYRPMSYTYNLAGDITGSGDGRVGPPAVSFAMQYDSVDRLIGLNGGTATSVTPLFSVQSYGPLGWTGGTFGPQLTSQRVFDNRARVTGETVVIP